MSADDAFNTLKSFLETRPASQQALSSLKENVEIGILLGGQIDCAVYQTGGAPMVERRLARNPDVVFHIRPESVYILNNQPGDDVGDIGVSVLKEVLAGNIQIKVPGSFMNILRNGYLDIIKQGGQKFWAFLSTRGLSSITKVISAIKKMK